MSRRSASLAWSIAGLGVAMNLFVAADAILGAPSDDIQLLVPTTVGALAMLAIGALIASRTRNPLGWILLAIPITTFVAILAEKISARVSSPAADAWLAWFNTWPFLVSLMLLVAVFYLFPTGALPSPRWRWPWRIYTCAVGVVAVGFALLPTVADGATANPFPLTLPEPLLSPVITAAGLLVFVSAFAAFVSLVVRYRAADSEQRQQLRWLFVVGATAAPLFVVMLVLGALSQDRTAGAVVVAANVVLLLLVTDLVVGIPVATGVAIFRYHLYDLNVVVRKTVVGAILAAFITAVYVAIVVGIGAIAGISGTGVLPLAATAVVALLFQPARLRAQGLANRLVYGVRATPYEVIAGFSAKMSSTVSTAEVLPDMAEAAGRGVGATSTEVTVFLPQGGEATHGWGGNAVEGGIVSAFPITYRGEPIGRLSVTKPASEPLSRAENELLTDLTAHAGLALHNVRLTEELAIRLTELDLQAAALRVSRERLVTARDAQRRGLQRDLQEGPERQLLRIGHRLDEAERADPETAATILDAATDTANQTLEGLRDLARGIFPPMLADKGIVPAVEGYARKVGAHATIVPAEGLATMRFDDDVEACVYFCCLQTIQNVMRHAGNLPCVVAFAWDGETFTATVRDEGPGFDPGRTARGMGLAIVQDRADALGGRVEIQSAPGAGTGVTIRIPARAREEVDVR